MTTSLDELIAAQSLGWLAGYDLARSQMQHWEPVAAASANGCRSLRMVR